MKMAGKRAELNILLTLGLVFIAVSVIFGVYNNIITGDVVEPFAQVQAVTNVSACGTLSIADEIFTLNKSINSGSTCITIGANNVTLDCNGFSITGSGGFFTRGVSNTGGYDDVTVKNCSITGFYTGIFFDIFDLPGGGTKGAIIKDNVVFNNSNEGILLSNTCSGNLITNNNASNNRNAGGGVGNGAGIKVACLNVVTSFNTVSSNIVNDNDKNGISLSGLKVIVSNNIVNNNLDNGIRSEAKESTFTSNTVIGNKGTAGMMIGSLTIDNESNFIGSNIVKDNDGFGIYLVGEKGSTVTSNTIEGNSLGLRIYHPGTIDNVITSNIIRNNAQGITFEFTARNNSLINNFVFNSSSTILITVSDTTGNNITNMTFAEEDGSVRFIDTINLPINIAISRNNLNVSFNNIFLNSSNISFMNTSAVLTFNNITEPLALVDFEDNGSFIACLPPQCNNVSYDGITFVFNVSSFTTYSGGKITEEEEEPEPAPAPSGGGGRGRSICSKSWSCTEWTPSICVDGIQDRACTCSCRDDKDCTGNENITRTCEVPMCKENWNCNGWSSCNADTGKQSRICTDNNNCGTIKDKPAEEQECVAQIPSPAPSFFENYSQTALIILLVGIFGALFSLARMMQIKKTGAYREISTIIKDAESALKRGNKAAATQYYVMLRYAVEKNKSSLSKMQFNRLYRKSVKLRGKIAGN